MLCGAPAREPHQAELASPQGGGGRDLCAGCAAELPSTLWSCAQCAIPLDHPVSPGGRCGTCQQHPPPFDLSLAAFRYEGPVASLVVDAKFRGRLNVVRLLGQCLAERILAVDPPRPEVLLPVPLHAARLRGRGYNQALEIARVVARRLDLPLAVNACRRLTATPPQAGLDERARRRNIRGAFRVEGAVPWSHVAILDDVMTTGSTVAELSRVLRRAGVRRIQIWAVARTP
ncbi:phosphoribosyltransferase [Thiocapsa imhoffii]|uniref:Phosphoribosyltransferase n=1 Tax=Thiocapsa imhoffii TaxID=382777 RepID=A0A9X0WJN3_9GAMM|nr:phosphoribosyltransferase [Thiocapsa imhoffii]